MPASVSVFPIASTATVVMMDVVIHAENVRTMPSALTACVHVFPGSRTMNAAIMGVEKPPNPATRENPVRAQHLLKETGNLCVNPFKPIQFNAFLNAKIKVIRPQPDGNVVMMGATAHAGHVRAA